MSGAEPHVVVDGKGEVQDRCLGVDLHDGSVLLVDVDHGAEGVVGLGIGFGRALDAGIVLEDGPVHVVSVFGLILDKEPETAVVGVL